MILVPAGSFEMGSREGPPEEAPVHTVHLDAFLIDRYEVTQETYRDLEMPDPSHFKGKGHPVEQVSWLAAIRFCNERSDAEGLERCYDLEANPPACNFEASGYRLPTEAEWEYACRAGTTTPTPFGRDARLLGDCAWFRDNTSKCTRPVGTRKPNAWGLFDMLGNVAEWCNEPYARDGYAGSPSRNPRGPARGERYAVRGGSWKSPAERCRPAARHGEKPGFTDACFPKDTTGFRCVRKATPAIEAAARDLTD